MANTASMDLGPVFHAAAQEWNIDPNLLQAVAGQESGGTANPDLARSTMGAQGRMQLMPGTAQEMGVTDTSDPIQNIYGGAKYLSQMLDRYGTPELALAAYNAGPSRVDGYLAGRNGLPGETVAYVPSIARRYQALAGSQQQGGQPLPQQPGAIPNDGGATQRLTQALAGLQQGNAPSPSADPTATAPAASPAPANDPFSRAMSAAQAAIAPPGSGSPGNGPGNALGGTGAPASMSGSTPAPVTVPADASDPFSQAMRAAQRASMPGSSASGGASPANTAPGGGTIVPAGDPRLQANDGSTAYRNPDGTYTLMPASGGGTGTTAAPAAAPQAETGYRIPYLGTQLPSVTNLAEGAGHAVLGASRALYSAINAGNNAVPIPGQTLGGLVNPQAALSNLDAEDAQYQRSGVGSTPAGMLGDMVGQTVVTLPAFGPLAGAAGAIGRGVAAAGDAVSPVVGGALRATGNLLSGTAAVPENKLLNMAVRPAALATNGAVQGAAVGALSGNPNAGLGTNMLTGAGAGALLGPVGAGVAAGAGRVLTGAKALVQPFTAGGRSAIADNALARMAVGGPLTPDTTAFVAGSTPTLAQATANPGLAGAERAVASVRPNPFTNQATINQDAREGLVASLRGGPGDIAAAEQARDATAVPAIQGAIANATGPADAQPVVDTIDQILASPAGQRDAVTTALGNIRSKLVTPIPFGDRVSTALDAVNGAITSNPGGIDPGLWAAREALVAARNGNMQQVSTLARLQDSTSSDPAAQAVIDRATNTIGTANRVETDPGQLYGIRKAIGDALSPLSANAGSNAQLASHELQQVQAALDGSIEGAAPGFRAGLDAYAAASRPIDAMRYLQSRNLTAADGTITLAKVKGALDDIRKQQALPGARDAKSIPQATIDGLQGLYDDLLRQNNSRLGMQPGSNTFQQLATSGAMAGMGAPLAGVAHAVGSIPVLGNALTGSIGRAYAAQNEPIMTEVVNKLMNPQAGASVLRVADRLQRQADAGPSPANLLLTAPGVNALMAGRARKQ